MGSNTRTGSLSVIPLAALLLLMTGAVAVQAAEEPIWGYNCEEGAPFEWGLLDLKFAKCLEGHEQSPIVISTTGSIHRPLPPLGFEYQTADLKVVNNGHTVEAHLPAGGAARGTLLVGDRAYRLERFHWHTPSEHWIDGNVLPMELHMVHHAPGGAALVVAAMIRPGDNNDELDKIWNVIPQHKGDEVAVPDFDLSKLLPSGRDLSSYRYNGSLTTPPCGEGVRFVLLADSVEMSPEQIGVFQAIFLGNEEFPVGNARPLQPRNDRRVVTDTPR
jgi:carbonic anhydrase